MLLHVFSNPPFYGYSLNFGCGCAANGMPSLRLIVLTDRHGADARQIYVRQARLACPGIELRLHLGEIAFGFDLLGDVETGVAQAGDHVLRCHKSVPADKAQEHLPGIAAEPAAALGEQIEQPDLVGGGPAREKSSKAAMVFRDGLDEGGILA